MKKIENSAVPEFKLGERIGFGEEGDIYELIGTDDNPINWVMKIMKSPVSNNEKKITQQFFKINIIDDKKFIMEKIKGGRLGCVHDYGFLNSLLIASLITHNLNLYHHNTPGRQSIAHNDIHSDNIFVDFDPIKNIVNSVNIFDFGRSSFVKNPYTMNPNIATIESKRPISSDVSSVGHLFSGHVFSRLYIYRFIYPKIFGIDIGIFVKRFIDFMIKQDDKEIPGSDEMYLFFHSLFRLYFFLEKEGNDDLMRSLLAKIIIMANRRWDDEIVSQEEKKPIAWKNFDFESENNISVCNAIIKISQNTLLNGSIEHLIPAVSKEIVSGDEKGFITHLVNKFGLDLLCHIKGDLEQRRDIAMLAISELLQQNKILKNEIVIGLETLAAAGKIDFLYKRQGFCQISVFNHQWKGKPVSATWLRCMTMIQRHASSVVVSIDSFHK